MQNPYPNNQRLLDLMKALDLSWPEQAVFVVCFNNDPNVGEVSDEIKTTTFTIHQADGTTTELGLNDIPVGHC